MREGTKTLSDLYVNSRNCLYHTMRQDNMLLDEVKKYEWKKTARGRNKEEYWA